MRTSRYAAVLLAVVCVAATALCAPAINRAAARRVSDSFMEALAANRIDDAAKLLSPEYLRKLGPQQAREHINTWLGYCGLPVDRERGDDERGVQTLPGGRRQPFIKFYYGGATTLYPRQTCWFMITIVASPQGPRVAQYGAEKQFGGEI